MISERFRLAFQSALAMVVAYGVALWMDWDKPMWAGFVVAFCGLGSVGESLNKGLLRVLGTLFAVFLALGLLSLFPQQRWPFLLMLSLWTGLCTYQMGTTSRWYFWFVAGFTVPLLTIGGGGEPVVSFDVVVLRAQETLLGLLSFALVSVLVLPVGSGRGFKSEVAALVAAQRKLADHYLAVLSTPRALPAPPPPANLDKTRADATRLLAALPGLLDAAEMDTYAIWESRRAWRRVLQDLGVLHRLLEHLRLNFDALADVDVPVHLRGVESVRRALNERLGHIETLLRDGATLREDARPELTAAPALEADLQAGCDTAADADADADAGHFDRAALALTRRQLAMVAESVRRLHGGVSAILALRRVSEPASSRPAGHPFLPDPQRIRGVVRQQAAFWLSALAVVYVPDLPLGSALLVMVTSLSMAMSLMPQARPLTLIAPVLTSVLFAGIIYVLIMPRLAGFPALAVLLFATTFWISWSNHLPSQAIGKSVGLAALAVILSVDNQQSYSFLVVANLALGLPMVLAILALTTYFPLSFRPQDRFQALLREWFQSAARVLGALGSDAERARQARSPLARWRFAADRFALQRLPLQLAAWGRALPPAALGHGRAADVQALVASVQTLAERIEALIRTRELQQSQAFTRALAEDVRAWRLAVQELLRQLAQAPEGGAVDELRARLDSRLRKVEERTAAAMAEDPDFNAHPELNENSYSLLGAYRGLSEALVRFSHRAGLPDWARLREARF